MSCFVRIRLGPDSRVTVFPDSQGGSSPPALVAGEGSPEGVDYPYVVYVLRPDSPEVFRADPHVIVT